MFVSVGTLGNCVPLTDETEATEAVLSFNATDDIFFGSDAILETDSVARGCSITVATCGGSTSSDEGLHRPWNASSS